MRILGDLTERESWEDKTKQSDAAMRGDWTEPNRATAGEVPLGDVAPADVEPRIPHRSNGGVGGYSGRSFRTPSSEAPAIREPKTGRSGLVTLLLLLILAGAVWYNFPTLEKDYQSVSQFPATQELVKTLGERANDTESQLRALTGNWETLQTRLAKLDRKVSSGLAAGRKHTEQLIAQARQSLEAELNQRTDAMNARVDKVESDQAETRNQLAQAEDRYQKEITALRQQVGDRQDNTDQSVQKLQDQVGQGQDGLHALAQEVHRQRVDFEVSENHTEELAPGVSITVLKTNVSYQSFDGFLSLTNEGRTVWLSNAGVAKAVSFYPTKQSARSYELVVTTISRKGVVGYLMVPEGSSQG
jgi:chaperonin cofactor prefoldin